jgi:hypothetical protein
MQHDGEFKMTNKNHLDNKFTYNLDGCNGIKFSALDGTRTTDETWFFKYEQADVYVRYVFIPSRMGENAFTLQAGRGKRNGKRGGLGCDQVDTVKHIFPVLEKRMREILHAQGWQETEYKDQYGNFIWLRPTTSEEYLDKDMDKPLDLNALAQALPEEDEQDVSEDRLERQAQAHLEVAALHRDDPMF